MTEPAVIRFTDPARGSCSVSVGEAKGGIALGYTAGSTPSVEVVLPKADAVRLARAVLDAAGENTEPARPQLPQSRQIGGIIGPY